MLPFSGPVIISELSTKATLVVKFTYHTKPQNFARSKYSVTAHLPKTSHTQFIGRRAVFVIHAYVKILISSSCTTQITCR